MSRRKLDLFSRNLLPTLANDAWHGDDLALLSYGTTAIKKRKEA
ncbi:MAG: hypothetical protein ACPH79_05330 [Paracoccaceae bacterium]